MKLPDPFTGWWQKINGKYIPEACNSKSEGGSCNAMSYEPSASSFQRVTTILLPKALSLRLTADIPAPLSKPILLVHLSPV